MDKRIAVLLLTVNFHGNLDAGSLRKLWELNLQDAMKSTVASDIFRPGVTALRFSPSGDRIAVAAVGYFSGTKPNRQLFVVHTDRPRSGMRHFEIQFASDSADLGPQPPAISWSAAGNMILAGRDLLHLEDGESCKLPYDWGIGFVGPGTISALRKDRSGPVRLDLFDIQCRSTASWELEGNLDIVDVSAERGVVGLLRKEQSLFSDPVELTVVDPFSRKVIQRWPTGQIGYMFRFTDRGNVICGGDDGPDNADRTETSPRCLSVSTGESVAEAPTTIVGGAPFAAATHGSRLVASDSRAVWNFIYREYDNVLRRRVVWDLKTGKELASWKPETQSYNHPGLSTLAKEPFVFAISPDGKYVAEGGNGIVRLYKIDER